MTEIPISEDFFSIQGEGPYAGHPAVFLRLTGCNLKCGLTESTPYDHEDGDEPEEGATWVCDTITTWRGSERLSEPSELIADWKASGFLDRLENGAHLVLTGGEPTLPTHQRAMEELFEEMDFRPFVEVETNGTIMPDEAMAYTDQFNVSLKLSNSGMDEEDRINEDAIQWYSDLARMDVGVDIDFKFVVRLERDIKEILDVRQRFSIPDESIMLMPAGYTQEQLRETYPEVAEICKDMGFRFSPRLHVDMWNQATGV